MNDVDPIFTPAGGVGVAFSAADEKDKLACHLVLRLPPPLGRIHVLLEADQIESLHDALHRALTMSAAEVREFVAHVRSETERNKK